MKRHEETYIDKYGNVGNVVVFDKKKNKKYKIKRRSKKVLAIGLSALIVLGVGKLLFKDDSSYDKNTVVITTESTTNYPDDVTKNNDEKTYYTYGIESGEDDVVPHKNFISLSVSKNHINEFKKYLSEKKVRYTYEDLYNIEKSYNNYKVPVINALNDSMLISSNKLNSSALYNQVLKNNDVYYNDVKNNNARAFYNELKDKEIKQICDFISEVINHEVQENDKLNLLNICKNLEHLKIFEDDTTPSNAYVNKNMCFLINKNFMDKIFKVYNNGRDCYDEVLAHEVMHLIQYQSSNMDDADGVEIGPFVSYIDSKEVNPLNLTWILESNAEIEMSNYTKTDITTYTNQVGYLKSVNLALSSSFSYETNAVYTIGFSKSFDDLYELFDARTTDEKKDVIKCLYSIEVSQVKDKNFYNAYKEKYSVDIEADNDLKTSIKQTCAREALLELSKFFYKNMCDNMTGNDFTLEDVFYMIRLWEADLLYHLEFNREEEYIKCKDFLIEYNDIQKEFFTMISKSLDCNVSYIFEEYDDYSMNTNVGNNYSLSMFDEKKKNFFSEIRDTRYKKGNPRISDIDNIMETKEKEIAIK